MGKRGPAPKIDSVRSQKKALAIGAPAIEACPGVNLYQPPDLDEYAIEEWGRLILQLERMRVLSPDNYLVVAQICRIESRRRKAQEQLNSVGMFVKGDDGRPVIHPALKIATECEAQLRAFYREVGITPAARQSVSKAKDTQQASKMAQLLAFKPKSA